MARQQVDQRPVLSEVMNLKKLSAKANNANTSNTANGDVHGEVVGAQTQHALCPKPYQTPELIFYGDVRDVTLGPTVGSGESNCESFLMAGPATEPCPFP